MRRVSVSEYSETWPEKFAVEADKLRMVFGSEVITVHHIGSTAVPGLAAKPVIDLMPVVKTIESVDGFNEKMSTLGYDAKGENGIAGRRYFQKGGDERSHHVHMYKDGSYEIIRHLAFRDYLRNFPGKAEEYGRLKQQLARRFPNDIESYINGKHEFAVKLEREALGWYQSK